MTLLDALKEARRLNQRAAYRVSPLLKRIYIAYSPRNIQVSKFKRIKPDTKMSWKYTWQQADPVEVEGFEDWKPDKEGVY